MSEKEGYSISNKWTFTANYGWVLLLSHPGKDDVIRILRWSDRVEMTLPRYLLRPAADTEDNQAAFQRLDAEFEQWDVQRRKDVTVQRWLQFLEDGGGTARRLWSTPAAALERLGLCGALRWIPPDTSRPDACVVGASWRR